MLNCWLGILAADQRHTTCSICYTVCWFLTLHYQAAQGLIGSLGNPAIQRACFMMTYNDPRQWWDILLHINTFLHIFQLQLDYVYGRVRIVSQIYCNIRGYSFTVKVKYGGCWTGCRLRSMDTHIMVSSCWPSTLNWPMTPGQGGLGPSASCHSFIVFSNWWTAWIAQHQTRHRLIRHMC